MTKTLLYTALFMALGTTLAASPVPAQNLTADDLTRMGAEIGIDPTGAMNDAGAGSASEGTVFLRGGAPINLRPGGYVNRQAGTAGTAGSGELMAAPAPVNTGVTRPSYSGAARETATTASAYNAGLAQSRAARTQQTRSLIPSPFPEGW